MHYHCFDTLARRVFTDLRQSRRAAVATLLAATLLRRDAGLVLAKKKAKTTTNAADACYPGGTTCIPGKGKNTSGCDFANSALFANRDVRGANLSNSNFFAANLRGTDFRGANLSGSCFVSADLTGAKLGASVNLHGAVFCNTKMPNGKIDNSGCEGETPCCHLREQDCPDGIIECWGPDLGPCDIHVGDLPGKIGTCYHFPFCCPCDPPDQQHWTDLCNQQVPACGGFCTALLHEPFIPAGCYCCPPGSCI
jgi:hypothetical protein